MLVLDCCVHSKFTYRYFNEDLTVQHTFYELPKLVSVVVCYTL